MLVLKLAFALMITVASTPSIAAPDNDAPDRAALNERMIVDPAHKPDLDHIAVWTEDLDKTAQFLEDALGWRRHPMQFGLNESDMQFGGMKLIFVDANGFWLELIQPTTPGPGMDLLKEKGDGALIELDFLVPDFQKNLDVMKRRGAPLAGVGGQPMVNGGLLQEWVIKDGKRSVANEWISYPSPDDSRGTSIEMYWEDETGVTVSRDAMWAAAGKAGTNDGPRLDHAVILAADLSKTTDFYRNKFALPPLKRTEGLRTNWMGVGDRQQSWIKANDKGFGVQVVGAPATLTGQALLKTFGDGTIMELAVEVSDISAFYDKMKARGTTMVADNEMPLPKGQKSVKTDTSAIHYNYFPRDKSKGIRIMVYQRDPGANSIGNQ